jgi:hypothetical protein
VVCAAGAGADAGFLAAGFLALTFFFAAGFLAAAFLAGAFLAATFFLAAGFFLAAAFLAGAFLAAGFFLAAAFFAGAFFAATFFLAAGFFLAAAFLAGAFLAATFLTATFLAAGFLATTFFFAAGFLAATFFFAAGFFFAVAMVFSPYGSTERHPSPLLGVVGRFNATCKPRMIGKPHRMGVRQHPSSGCWGARIQMGLKGTSPSLMCHPFDIQSHGFQKSCVLFSSQSSRSSMGTDFPRLERARPVLFARHGDWQCSEGSL